MHLVEHESGLGKDSEKSEGLATVTTGGGTGSSQCTYLLDCARAESSFTAPSNTLTWDTAEGHLLEVGQDVKPTLFSVPAHTWGEDGEMQTQVVEVPSLYWWGMH